MATTSMTQASVPRRGTSAWYEERRRLCKTPTNMLASAAILRTITGAEGRRLYGGQVPDRIVRRTFALAARLEREAARWELERRAARNAARRARARKEPLRVAA
jgi:hypothetical protein